MYHPERLTRKSQVEWAGGSTRRSEAEPGSFPA
jgi:hypothetical protein